MIHNSIQVPAFKRTEKSQDGIKIISVCRFVQSKDFDTALYSFKKLVEKNAGKEIKYYIVGYGPMENKIRSLVRSLELE